MQQAGLDAPIRVHWDTETSSISDFAFDPTRGTAKKSRSLNHLIPAHLSVLVLCRATSSIHLQRHKERSHHQETARFLFPTCRREKRYPNLKMSLCVTPSQQRTRTWTIHEVLQQMYTQRQTCPRLLLHGLCNWGYASRENLHKVPVDPLLIGR